MRCFNETHVETRTTIVSWQAEGVQPPPKMVPTPPCPLSAKHEKIPQLPPYQTKMFWTPHFCNFFCIFPGPPLLGREGEVPAMGFLLLLGKKYV